MSRTGRGAKLRQIALQVRQLAHPIVPGRGGQPVLKHPVDHRHGPQVTDVPLQRQLLKQDRLLQDASVELRRTQAMLIQAEKMSVLGQPIAGVAHEIDNRPGFVIGNLHSL